MPEVTSGFGQFQHLRLILNNNNNNNSNNNNNKNKNFWGMAKNAIDADWMDSRHVHVQMLSIIF